MKIKNFALRLTDVQYKQVSEFSEQLGISRNACICMCIHSFFKQQNTEHNKEVHQDNLRLTALKKSILKAK